MSQKNKEIVEQINASFAEGNTQGFLDHCAEDIKWTMCGEKTVEGKAAIKEWMSSMECPEPPQFTVDTLVAEGDTVIASGDMTMKGDDGKTVPYAYCDIYRFTGDKVVELRSLVVKTADSNLSATA